jgi:hypothetical protein
MTESSEDYPAGREDGVNGKGDDFADYISKIILKNLSDPSVYGLVFNPMTMEYEQPCGYGPNGEPEFLDDFDDDD